MRNFRKYTFFIFSLFFVSNSFNASSQETKLDLPCNQIIDSLQNILKLSKTDTSRINTLIAISNEYIAISNYTGALIFAEQANEKAEKIIYQKGIINSYNSLGIAYRNSADYKKALSINLKSLKICKQSGYKIGIGDAYYNIGQVYYNLGDYNRAYENFLVYLKISEEIGNNTGIANAYNNIGIIFGIKNKYDKALNNFTKSLNIRIKLGEKKGIAICYNNIGRVQAFQKNYKDALNNYLKSLKIKEECADKKGIASAYNNIADIYLNQNNFNTALLFHKKSLKIRENTDDKSAIAASYNDIGNTYLKLGEIDTANYFLNMSLKINLAIGQKDGLLTNYNLFSELFEKKQAFNQSLKYHKLYSDIKDSLFNEQSDKKITEMDSKYEFEEKEKNIELLKKDKELQELELHKQKIIRNGFLIGLIIFLFLAILLYNRFLIKKKLNTTLSDSNNELIKKNLLIEKQKEKIIDSITYAQLIQQSILMEETEIQKLLPNFFLYYQPKDIVSGDFYWCSKINNKIILAAIDCTGHGVPGAFMSMIGNTLLNQIVNEKHITMPSEILRLLNIGIYEALHQEKEGILASDGMDIALIMMEFDELNNAENLTEEHKNEKKATAQVLTKLEYAGAQIPLYYIVNNELTVIKGNRLNIGGCEMISKKEKPLLREYTNHDIPIKKNMSIYLFSDGYMDQFKEKEKTKFGIQNFKNLLLENQNLDMQIQKKFIENAHEQWKGKSNQIDDILVLGVKL